MTKKAKGKWTPEMVKNMSANPVYAGVGPYPPIVLDALWIEAGEKLIHEIGPEESRTLEQAIDCRQERSLVALPSAELLALAKRAVETVAARGEVDVKEWAARLAGDVAQADD